MNFGSKYVYMYDHSDEESVSDESDAEQQQTVPDPYCKQLTSDVLQPVRPVSSKKKKSHQFSFKNLFKGKKESHHVSPDVPEVIFPVQAAGPASHVPPILAAAGSDTAAPALQTRQASGSAAKTKSKKKVRKADTNVFTVQVGKLVVPQDVQQGNSAVKCLQCTAVLTGSSKYEEDSIGGTNRWVCEFCGTENSNIDTAGWSKPTSEDITYLLEPAPVTEAQQTTDDDYNVIFVIDVSGSMGSSQACDTTDANGRTTRTYVSRLDAVKMAAQSQISKLKDESPNVRVGLVSFGSDVTVHGDGSSASVCFNRVKTEDMNTLLAHGQQHQQLKPINETYNQISAKIDGLTIRGCTALGPALLIATSMASSRKRSKVIICTDGCANEGIGSLPDSYEQDENKIASCRAEYQMFGDYAKDCGVTISVISLKGTDCRLVHLGLVAQITGGLVDIVDQTNLTDQFGNILSTRTLATNVRVTVVLQHNLYIRDSSQVEQPSVREENVGNADADTELVIEFGVRTAINENENPVPMEVEDNLNQAGESAVDTITEEPTVSPDGAAAAPASSAAGSAGVQTTGGGQVPFQVQVVFTARDEAKYLRVVTGVRSQTTDREVAEQGMNIGVVGAAMSNFVSKAALKGNHMEALMKLKSNKKQYSRRAEMVQRSRRDSISDEEEDLELYGGEIMELESAYRLQRQAISLPQGAVSHAAVQNCMPDMAANMYIGKASKSSAAFAAKKMMKRKS